MRDEYMSMARLCSVSAVVGVAVGLSVPVSSFAAIDLIPKEITIEQGIAKVRVINNGERAEYVSISLSRLRNPGVPVDEEQLDPVTEVSQPSLYASPFRMSLGPGQTKVVTLKAVKPVETEVVYRLDVKPIVKVLGTDSKTTSGSVVVNLAFSGLVRQLPAKQHEKLAVACEADGALLKATGTVRYRVAGAKADHVALDGFNVYPGVPISVPGRVVEIPGHQICEGR